MNKRIRKIFCLHTYTRTPYFCGGICKKCGKARDEKAFKEAMREEKIF